MSTREMLKTRGLRATPKRVALLGILQKAAHPMTAEEMHAKVRADLVTIYRNLQNLVAAGIVSEVRFKDSSVRYEFSHGHHHHVVCTNCGIVEELAACDVSMLQKKALQASGFSRINEHSLEFFGLCRSCA
ncbi:MAG: Fur family transcriptional regulator [Minisyncoccia bacterium]